MNNNTDTIVKENIALIVKENTSLLAQIDSTSVAATLPILRKAKALFVVGAGRSGLMLKAAAMRLMHLGLQVYVVGETTTPAITKGDVLLVASGSGTTSSIVKASEKAKVAAADIILLTTTAVSPLAQLASHVIIIPAAQKQDHGSSLSGQYAGSLFEQGVLLLSDAIFQTLWQQDGTPAAELWKRHANLE